MDLLRTLLSRIAAIFRARRLDASLDEELGGHIDFAIEEHIRHGVPAAEARRLALREFGGVTQVRESYRVRRGIPFLEQILRDLRFGILQLYKAPGFTLTAILTLALGVGANTTVFSMINGLLLRPLPVPESGRLVVIGANTGGPKPYNNLPEPLYRGLARQHGAFGTIFAFSSSPFQVKSGTSTEKIFGQYVSGTFFDALETAPLLGRTLNTEDDRRGGSSAGFAAVISEELWTSRFHRDPALLGRHMVVDNVDFSIVGVMPRSFFGADPLQRPQIFVPLADEEVLAGERSMIKFGKGAWWLSLMARLAPGATVDQASSQLSAATSAILHESVPDEGWIKRWMEERHFRFIAERGSTGFTYIRLNFRKPLVAVFAMCGGILLLACLNLASLLIARGTARQRELATRMALGASRRRLVQQLLVEGLLLGVGGTIAGLALAPAVSRLLVAVLLSGQRDVHLDTSLDLRVFAFAAATAILATLLFALGPAIKATSRSLMDRMKDGQHTTLTHDRAILPRILLGIEVGLALILVVGAGLVATSLVRIYNNGEGFDPHGLQNIDINLENAGYKGVSVTTFYNNMAERLRHLNGVTGVSYQLLTPLKGFQWDEDFPDTRGTNHDTYINTVAPEYFGTMRIPVLAGREFTWNDTPASGMKIILNQTASRQLFPDGNAVGRTIHHDDGRKTDVYEVIAVVGDAKYSNIRSAPPATAYYAMSQGDSDSYHSPSYSAVVRTTMPAGRLAGEVRAITAQMAPQIPAPEVRSMEQIIDAALGSERMMTLLAVFFAVCALVVTAIGLYGTLSYATARRTTEIGIRMALGARRSQVAAMVFGQNLWVVMGGTVAGLAAALLATPALASFLFLTSGHDPWVIAASIGALALTACAASLLPALRAAQIEPMTAIRWE